MARPTSVRKKRPDESVMEFARYLLDLYADDVDDIRILFTNGESAYESENGYFRITWRIPHNLETLLHEIGHHRLRHRNPFASRTDELIAEAEAWLWAERKAKQHGITFDYETAEGAYAAYTWKGRARGPVIIDWRYKDQARHGSLGDG